MTCLEDWKQLAIIENQRARRNWRGLENNKPIEDLALNKETGVTQHIRNLHLDGVTPDEIATQVACPEIVVWKNIRGLYTVRAKLSDAYRQLRVDRVLALKKQGLQMLEIAKIMGFTRSILDKDLHELAQQQSRATSIRKKHEKDSAWLKRQTPNPLPRQCL